MAAPLGRVTAGERVVKYTGYHFPGPVGWERRVRHRRLGPLYLWPAQCWDPVCAVTVWRMREYVEVFQTENGKRVTRSRASDEQRKTWHINLTAAEVRPWGNFQSEQSDSWNGTER